MKFFRYRPANTNTFGEIAEQKAWYSRYSELNDPFEGLYVNQSGEGTFNELIGQFRVCCFSKRNDILLLWAHYTENHRGLCLEYEVSEEDYRSQFFPIKYRNAQPVLEKVERRPDGTLSIHIEREGAVYLTKSEDWAYEEEYRLIRFARQPNAKGEMSSVPGILSAVYFGIRADPTVVRIVSQLLSAREQVILQRASLLSGQYALTFTIVARDGLL
jgi:hypothetical protein